MRHHRKGLGLAALVGIGALAAQGCGSATRQVETREVPDRSDLALGWLPPDSFVTVHVNVTRLRESPYADTVGGWLDAWITENPEIDESDRRALETLGALWKRTRELHVGATYPEEPRRGDDVEVVAVLRGRYGDGALQRSLRRLPEVGETLKTGRWRGRRAIELDEIRGIRVDSSTWVFTRDVHVERVMQREDAPSTGLRSDALRRLHRDLELRRGAVGITLVPVGELRDAFLGELLDGYGAEQKRAAASLEAVGLRIDVSDGLQMRCVASMADAGAAHDAKRRMDEMSLRYRRNAFVILGGLDLLLERTQLRVSGNQAVGVLDLDHAQAHALLFHWDRLARGAAAFVLGDADGGGILRELAPGLPRAGGPGTAPGRSPAYPGVQSDETSQDRSDVPAENAPVVDEKDAGSRSLPAAP